MTLKNAFGKCSLFVLPANGWRDEKIKTWPLRFPAKENPNMEKALFDWPIVFQYDVKPKYRLISRKFLVMKFFHPSVCLTNQKPHAFVSVRYQSNRSISVSLLFLFQCSRVFISMSYENRSTVLRQSQDGKAKNEEKIEVEFTVIGVVRAVMTAQLVKVNKNEGLSRFISLTESEAWEIRTFPFSFFSSSLMIEGRGYLYTSRRVVSWKMSIKTKKN